MSTTKKILLFIYQYFQWIITSLNILFFVLFVKTYILLLLYIMGNIWVFIMAVLLLLMATIYLVFSIVATITTQDIIDGKPLRRIQKFSEIVFLAITIPLYIFIIFNIKNIHFPNAH